MISAVRGALRGAQVGQGPGAARLADAAADAATAVSPPPPRGNLRRRRRRERGLRRRPQTVLAELLEVIIVARSCLK